MFLSLLHSFPETGIGLSFQEYHQGLLMKMLHGAC